jgi:hypothetical protein
LLLRCVAYVNQPDLVSAVIVDAEKCVELLHGMEETWPGARRCREIVSDLLVVVKAKHYGGPLALENIQTVRNQGQASFFSDRCGDADPSVGQYLFLPNLLKEREKCLLISIAVTITLMNLTPGLG